MKKHFIIITLFSLQNIVSFGQGSQRWKEIIFNSTTFKVRYDKYKIPQGIIDSLFEAITDIANPKEKVNGKPLQLKWFAVDKDENYVICVTIYGSHNRNLCFLFKRASIYESEIIEEIQGNLNFKDFKTFFLGQDIKVDVHQLKSGIDSSNFRNGISSDLLPPEFNSPALENEYYYNYTDYAAHVSILRLRDNQAFIYETYYYNKDYKPGSWVKISLRIGNYRISGDTIYVTYKQLLTGKPKRFYLTPTAVSWHLPKPPDYLLLNNDKLYDPVGERCFNYLTDKPQFNLEGTK